MDAEKIRAICMSFPQVTEHMIWGNDLTFKVAGKMFAHTVLEPAPVWLSFKTSTEHFHELTERAGIIPAPYLARAQWVALETRDALAGEELSQLLRDSYNLVVAKLPKKMRDVLCSPLASSAKQKSLARRAPRAKPLRSKTSRRK
jgi:predicted DNA-binding protein (MmcQ/YjbR family)